MAGVHLLGMDRPARAAVVGGLCLAPLIGVGIVYSAQWLVLGIVVIGLAVALLRRPVWGVYGLVGGTFFDSIAIETPFAVLGAGDLAALGLIAAWMAHRLINPRGIRIPRRGVLLLGYFVLAFASLATGVSPASAVGGYTRLVIYGITMLAVVDLVRDIDAIERITIIMALCGLLHAIIGLGFMGTTGRLAGLIKQPNLLGVLIALGAFPMAGWIIRAKNQVTRWLLVGCLMLMALGIVLTISRGTYIAVAIGFMWWVRRSVRLALALAIVLGGTFIAMTHFAHDRIDRIERRLEFQDSSVVNRGIVAKNALRTIAEAPLLGIGFGQFGHAHAAVDFTREIGRGSHNFYLGTAASTGLPALLLFLAFLFTQARRIGVGLKNARNQVAGAFEGNWMRYEWAMALFETLMVYHASSLMVRGGQRLMEWTFFSLYAALAAVAVTAKKSTSEPEQSSEPPPAE